MSLLWRLSGAGNDFLARVGSSIATDSDRCNEADYPEKEQIAAWCQRGVSAGADGLFVLQQLEGQPTASVRMTHFNADGSRAELCVNGTRCAARLAFHLGWATDSIIVETDSGRITARPVSHDEIQLDLSMPKIQPISCSIEIDGMTLHTWFQRVGVPHLVVDWPEDLGECPVSILGPRLRNHSSVGTSGANVDFVNFLAPHRLAMRTFERGVERETLACGSGILAAVACGVHDHRLQLPVEIEVASGHRLEVIQADSDPRGRNWSLKGDARIIARLELLPGASDLPRAPTW